MNYARASWSMSPLLRNCQLLASFLSCATAAAVLGTAAHTLHVFNVQRGQNNPWWLPLWPQHFNVTGTYALITTSALVVALNALCMIAFAVPKFKNSNASSSFIMIGAVSLACLAVSLLSIIYAQIVNNRVSSTDTIQTWTCRFKRTAVATPGTIIPTSMSNDSFGSLCIESRFAYFGTVGVAALELIILLAAVVGSSKERSASRNGMEWQDKAPSPSLS